MTVLDGLRARSVCVTGGAGFIGSHTVRRLLDAGYAVTVLDDLSTGRREQVDARARFVPGSILHEGDVMEALRGCDAVLHLAARVAIRSSFDFVFEDMETNAAGTAMMLRCAARAGTVRRFVSTSSMAVYADEPLMKPVGETHPTLPISPYGVSKLACERLTHLYCAQAGMESVVLRLFNTYGPGQAFSPYVGVVTIFVNQLRDGKQPTIFGDGLQCRDLVHVADVAQGFELALTRGVSGETYNIGSGQALALRVVYEAVCAAMGTGVAPVYAPAAAGELRYSVAEVRKAVEAMGYAPSKDFRACLPAVVEEILGVVHANSG